MIHHQRVQEFGYGIDGGVLARKRGTLCITPRWTCQMQAQHAGGVLPTARGGHGRHVARSG
ncbi:hypothetical protein AHAS_Ahas02G0211800 [Arachis hypogaea]